MMQPMKSKAKQSAKHCAERRRIRPPLIAMKAAVLSRLQVWNKTYSIWQHPQSLDSSLDFSQVTFCITIAFLFNSSFFFLFFNTSFFKLHGIKIIYDATLVILLAGNTPQIHILFHMGFVFKRQKLEQVFRKKCVKY